MEHRKVVLITGCSSGIGLATSVYLAKKGCKVYASMRDLKKKDALLSEAKKAGVPVELLQLDVTNDKSVKNAVAALLKKEGRIDVLVNNAGFGSGGFLEDFTMEEIKDQFETNFFGLIRVTQAVLPAMRKQRAGCIVNISSIGGKIAFPVIGIYNASKFAVEALTESLRVELAPFGIKATAVEPASISTRFSESIRAAKKSKSPGSPYYGLFKRFEKSIGMLSAQSDGPIAVAKAIHRAISSKSPKRSYPAGKGARMILLLRVLVPNCIFERVLRKLFFGGAP